MYTHLRPFPILRSVKINFSFWFSLVSIACTLNIRGKTIGAGGLTVVHEGRLLLATCRCRYGLHSLVEWRIDDRVVRSNFGNVSHTPTESLLTVDHVMKHQQGLLCCRRNSVPACSKFLVISKPNVTISFWSEKQCPSQLIDSDMMIVEVTCTVLSYTEADINLGSMYLALNGSERHTSLHQTFVISNKTNQWGRNVWNRTFIYMQKVPYRVSNSFECQWYMEDGNREQSPVFSSRICPVSASTTPNPTSAASVHSAIPTWATTTQLQTDVLSNTSTVSSTNDDGSLKAGKIAGIGIAVVLVAEVVVVLVICHPVKRLRLPTEIPVREEPSEPLPDRDDSDQLPAVPGTSFGSENSRHETSNLGTTISAPHPQLNPGRSARGLYAHALIARTHERRSASS
jgi:hypothetical protein